MLFRSVAIPAKQLLTIITTEENIMKKTITLLAVVAGLSAMPAVASESVATPSVTDQVVDTTVRYANPLNWFNGSTMPAPMQLNLATPDGYKVFLDPETYVQFMNPAFYAQFMSAEFYTPFFKGENLSQWLNPVTYVEYVNPMSYLDLVNPMAYGQYLNPAVYAQSINPLAYVGFIQAKTYQGWADLVSG